MQDEIYKNIPIGLLKHNVIIVGIFLEFFLRKYFVAIMRDEHSVFCCSVVDKKIYSRYDITTDTVWNLFFQEDINSLIVSTITTEMWLLRILQKFKEKKLEEFAKCLSKGKVSCNCKCGFQCCQLGAKIGIFNQLC